MTCIVGFVGDDGAVWMGGDSAGISGIDLCIRADTKVFTRGPFIMGFTGSFRMGQILRYQLETPAHPDGMSDSEYMNTCFIDAVRDCLKKGGFAAKRDEVERGGNFLVGYHGKLYDIQSDYQVAEYTDHYASVGCGYAYALGALYMMDVIDPSIAPVTQIEAALAAAEQYSAGVRGPYVILSQR
jgi:hypothetical protein